MTLLDLTHSIYPGMPVYPGTDTPVLKRASTLLKDGFAESKIQMSTHTGTHMDAPNHLLEGAASLDTYPVAAFTGRGVTLDCSGLIDRNISAEIIQKLASHAFNAEYLLLYTGWDRFWGKDAYYQDYPILDIDAVRWATDNLPLKGVGADTISVDAEDQPRLPIHRHLLEKGILIVENLTNLKALLGKPFVFYAFPIKLKDADGAPVRAAAHILGV